MLKKLSALAAAVAILAAPSVANAAPEQVPDPLPDESLAEVATAAGLNTLVAAADAAGLVPTLADCTAGPFTVFAPTDDAFAALLAALGLTADELLADTELLTTVLTYHVVSGILASPDVVASTSLTTLQGEDIAVNGTVLNDSVNIAAPDNFACNGVAHVIDAVLLPPSIADAPDTTEPPAPAPAPELPPTGNNTTMALLASILVAAGFALMFARRRIA